MYCKCYKRLNTRTVAHNKELINLNIIVVIIKRILIISFKRHRKNNQVNKKITQESNKKLDSFHLHLHGFHKRKKTETCKIYLKKKNSMTLMSSK